MASSSAADALAAEAEEISLDDDFDLEEFKNDQAVQDALSKGTDLRQYAQEVEAALRSVERESIQDYIGESESLAGLHTQIKSCDSVLDSMESMLRGFQTDLAAISTQIKYLQDESLSMNVKLRNRKAAESQLSGFIQQIVVPPDLITAICESEVNEAYLAYVVELNKKVSFAKQESTAMTSACADMAPELEKLRSKSVQKIRDFLLQRVASLKKKMTNIQILQQSVLLKYKGLYQFLLEHAPDVAAEVKESYTTTMSAIYLRHVKGYLTELMRAKLEPATKSDLLGTEEWAMSGSAGRSCPSDSLIHASLSVVSEPKSTASCCNSDVRMICETGAGCERQRGSSFEQSHVSSSRLAAPRAMAKARSIWPALMSCCSSIVSPK